MRSRPLKAITWRMTGWGQNLRGFAGYGIFLIDVMAGILNYADGGTRVLIGLRV